MKNIFLFIILASSFVNAFASTYKFEITSPFADQIREKLKARKIDFGHGSGSQISLFTSREDINLKELIGYPHFVISKSQSTPFYEAQFNKSVKKKQSLAGYFDYSETSQVLKRLEASYSSYAKVYDLNKLFNLPLTDNGNSLLALQVSKNPGAISNKPKILFIAQHHARELMTHHSVVDTARELLEKITKGNSVAMNYIENATIWFVPVVNPDGLNYVFSHDRWWRKNRRNNLDGTFGVDLNRNYEFGWGVCGSNSSSGDSNIYRGESPQSEVETKVMDALNNLLKAQYVVSYHSAGNEVLYPYVCHKDTLTDELVYNDLRDRLAGTLGFSKRYASSSGEDFEHHFNKHGSLSFLIELGEEFQPSFKRYKSHVLPNVRKILPFLMQEIERDFLEVTVINKKSGLPVSGASIIIDAFPLKQNEVRVTDGFGVLRRKLYGVSQVKVKVSKPGFSSQSRIVKLSHEGNTQVQIEI